MQAAHRERGQAAPTGRARCLLATCGVCLLLCLPQVVLLSASVAVCHQVACPKLLLLPIYLLMAAVFVLCALGVARLCVGARHRTERCARPAGGADTPGGSWETDDGDQAGLAGVFSLGDTGEPQGAGRLPQVEIGGQRASSSEWIAAPAILADEDNASSFSSLFAAPPPDK
jgi:hypothetical protein